MYGISIAKDTMLKLCHLHSFTLIQVTVQILYLYTVHSTCTSPLSILYRDVI